MLLASGSSGQLEGVMAYEVEVRPLSRISSYISVVMSVISVTPASKPLRVRRSFGEGNRDDGMTVSEHTRNSPSRITMIGMGKSAANDPHNSDDDELQRFSKWGASLSPETRACVSREHGEHNCDEVRCRSGTQSAYFFPNISYCSSGLPSRSASEGPYSQGPLFEAAMPLRDAYFLISAASG